MRYLELRHENPIEHPALGERMTGKVHMRLDLPGAWTTCGTGLAAKVRNQVRKGQKSGLTAAWGGAELLREFYASSAATCATWARRSTAAACLPPCCGHFPERAELCVVRAGAEPVAAALLLHGDGVSEVPSASSLREHNATCANMLLYWYLARTGRAARPNGLRLWPLQPR